MHRPAKTARAYVQSKAMNKQGYLKLHEELSFSARAIATGNLDNPQSPVLPRTVLRGAEADHDEEGLFVLAITQLLRTAQNITNSDKENRQETLGMTDKDPRLYVPVVLF